MQITSQQLRCGGKTSADQILLSMPPCNHYRGQAPRFHQHYQPSRKYSPSATPDPATPSCASVRSISSRRIASARRAPPIHGQPRHIAPAGRRRRNPHQRPCLENVAATPDATVQHQRHLLSEHGANRRQHFQCLAPHPAAARRDWIRSNHRRPAAARLHRTFGADALQHQSARPWRRIRSRSCRVCVNGICAEKNASKSVWRLPRCRHGAQFSKRGRPWRNVPNHAGWRSMSSTQPGEGLTGGTKPLRQSRSPL